MNVFEFTDYHAWMSAKIGENSHLRGYLSRMAEAGQIQKSYLSRVLKSDVHLTPEQAFHLSQFWEMNETESDYFLAMVHYGRTSQPALRRKILRQMNAIKLSHADLAKRFRQDSLEGEKGSAFYYSSWIPSAVHMLVHIEKFQSADAISTRLQLARATVIETLERLSHFQIVTREGARWLPAKGNIHLAKSSNFITQAHANWRMRAINDAFNRESDALHYSAIHTLSTDDFSKLREMISEFIERHRKVVASSPEEDIFCFCVDWFRA